MKKYIIEYTQLMKEWDWERNNNLKIFPAKITHGSHKKVYWVCKKGHSWKAEVKSRVCGNGCKYCAGQAFTPERALSVKYPDIAKEWDHIRNGNITPEQETYGSHRKVFWICPKCSRSYATRIYNRVAGKGCCYCCHNPKPSKTYNLLLEKPTIAKEWDYNENYPVRPENITPYSNEKYYWICSNGHSYSATVNNRSNNYGCPYCANQKTNIENCLVITNPDLAKQWYNKKNKETPYSVTAGSNRFAWWRCERGHIWKAKINNRNNGKGCPECNKGHHSSFPEQLIYYYIKELFSDAINRYKIGKHEIDIYIPQLKIGIEYDGEYYHNTIERINKDLFKNSKLHNSGIQLIRIRESKCLELNDKTCIIYTYKHTSNYKYLSSIIEEVLAYLADIAGINKICNINIDEVRNNILSELKQVPKENNLAYCNVPLSKEWDYKKNNPLTPNMFLPGSDKKVYWKCSKCNLSWAATISSRNAGCGCSRCAKRYQYSTSEWVEKAKTIHNDRYNYSKTTYINSKTKIIIICSIHGEFFQTPSDHLSRKGCKYCAGQGFHPNESLSIMNPKIASEWDYEKNKESGLNPDLLGRTHKYKFWWKCNNGKDHSYKATVQYRIKRNSGCAICHGKQITTETSLAFLRPDLIEEWHKDNCITPWDVSIGSEIKILWKCNNKDHEPYYAVICSRTGRGSGCPECAGNKKTHLVYSKELKDKFPNIELLNEYQKSGIRIRCRCENCKYEWTPFPYNLLKGKGCPRCRISPIIKTANPLKI